jgi:hypothetical protein
MILEVWQSVLSLCSYRDTFVPEALSRCAVGVGAINAGALTH